MSTTTHSLYLDLAQAQAEYGISRRSLWYLIERGKLKAYQPLRKTLLKRRDLEELIESARVGAGLDKLVDEVVNDLSTNKNA